ncbi:MAG: UDP-N-acetylmuramate dehydrogenase [Candidatus Binatia bacterium]|nr:UDP-N-acetylmuramate dehydrogenase [Candidatus Binatia bacterium]MDG1959838.1 UDP-N-acetylmuramate dehydrogenase [Candidatus Binatia bacterium]MDG2010101.1 UDP-N-acetylmuramate dehydrogenase [Candidatus Binatia bacterium]
MSLHPQPISVRRGIPLRDCTTLELGGPATYFFEAMRDEEIPAALAWADQNKQRLTTVGGGSNIVVADAGLAGLVLRIGTRGIRREPVADGEVWSIAAGENWDDIVAAAVTAELSGIECLSGIPGRCGAAPLQNIGAYGQEISETLVQVQVIDRTTHHAATLAADELAFAYRDSRLKRESERWIVTGITLHLRSRQAPALRYPGLEQAVRARGPITLASCREAVLELRRSKSMVYDPTDPNHRSAGSFFLNPILPEAQVAALEVDARTQGVLAPTSTIPTFPATPGCRKIPAAWLIEHSGFSRGQTEGRVGLSSRHTLALINHGGSSTDELLAFARTIRDGVENQFGVRLEAEPVMLGFPVPPLESADAEI